MVAKIIQFPSGGMNMRNMQILHLTLMAAIVYDATTAKFASAFTQHTHSSIAKSSYTRRDYKTLAGQQQHWNQRQGRGAATAGRLSHFRLFSSKPPTPDFFKGAPSTPGFKPGQFDRLSSWAQSTTSNRPIVTEYEPDGLWLWTQWGGTIPELTYKTVIIAISWALLVDLYCYQHYQIYILATAALNGGDVGTVLDNLSGLNLNGGDVGTHLDNLSWSSFEIPHSKDPIIETLTALNSLWEYQLSLAIFTLSFFVNHAYSSWRSVYFCTRAIQGRINDLCLLVTLAAKRTASFGDVKGTTGYQSTVSIDPDNVVTESSSHRDSKRLVHDVTRLLRMSHVFFWAATPTCSDGFGDRHITEGGLVGDDFFTATDFDLSQYGPMLLSTQGLQSLVRYGQITENEMNALISTGLPPSQYPYVLLNWSGLRCMDGMETGELRGGPGMEENLLKYLTQLRAEYFSIGDFNAGRMPMAYVQIMEVLVDTICFLAPLALYVKMGTFNIISTGLLTLFFKGLLELSKSFLDPFGREGYRAHNIRVDVLVSEMNFGASSRWVEAGDALPSAMLAEIGEQHETTPESMVNATFSEWMASDYDNLNKRNAGAVNLQHKKQENAIEEKKWFDNPQGKAENTNGAMDEPSDLVS